MALRVSRQLIEVLVSGESQIKVTRQQIEALHYDPLRFGIIADTLTLNQTVFGGVTRYHTVTDSLSFVDHSPAKFLASADSTLTFTEECHRIKEATATDSLEFTDVASYFHIIEDFYPTGDYLTFIEWAAIVNGKWQFVPDTLSFVSTLDWHGPIYKQINHYLSYTENIRNNNNYRVTISDLLDPTDWAGRPYNLTATDSLTFVQDGWRGNPIYDSLVFSELAIHAKGGTISSILNLTQTVVVHGSFLRDAGQLLNLGQSTSYYFITPCIDKQYHPFVGTSDVIDQVDAPNNNLPITQYVSTTNRFQLIYPARGGILDSVILRAPEIDSKDTQAFNRINRETRGGYLVVFSDPQWPKTNTVSCTFTGLTKVEIDTLQSFILNYIGEEIQIVDWEGGLWIGVVLKPNTPATCDGKNKWSIGFEFEGNRLDNYNPGLSLVFSDAAINVVLRRPITSDSLVFNHLANYQVN